MAGLILVGHVFKQPLFRGDPPSREYDIRSLSERSLPGSAESQMTLEAFLVARRFSNTGNV